MIQRNLLPRRKYERFPGRFKTGENLTFKTVKYFFSYLASLFTLSDSLIFICPTQALASTSAPMVVPVPLAILNEQQRIYEQLSSIASVQGSAWDDVVASGRVVRSCVNVLFRSRGTRMITDGSETTSCESDKQARKRRRFRVEIPAESAKEAMKDLSGTTAARVKTMTTEERDMVLLKRKIRNRESATRSNLRRQEETNALQQELRDALCNAENDLQRLEAIIRDLAYQE